MDKERATTKVLFEYPEKNTIKTTIEDTETGIKIVTTTMFPERILQLSGSKFEGMFRALCKRTENLLVERFKESPETCEEIRKWLRL